MATHLIAFQIGDEESPQFRANSARWLYDLLGDFPGKVNPNDPDMEIEEWWHASDERFDRSDNDSAVFVTKGQEGNAYALLRDQKVSGQWNSIQHGDPDLVAPQYDATLTGEQRIAFIRDALALATTYSVRTGGRNLVEDIRAYETLDDYVTDDESISDEDKEDSHAFEQVLLDYLTRPVPEGVVYFLDDDNGELVWNRYYDRLHDWYADESYAREGLM